MVTEMTLDSDEDDDLDVDYTNLTTIKNFDSGGSMNPYSTVTRTTIEVTSNEQSLQSRIATKASAPVSLLVESLLQQLCSLLESDPERSRALYKTICERLHAVNLIDETYTMGEFEMMRSQYQKALYHLVSITRGNDLPVVLPDLQEYWPLPSGLEWSRYYREFEELSFIAGGGFGKVYRSRNKLDDTVYAVKKVTIRSTTIKNVLVHLAEVKTLASLNHINIVPYKAAWLEPLMSPGKSNSSNSASFVMDEEDDYSSQDEDDDEAENSVNRRTKRDISDSLRRPEHDSEEFSILFENSSEGQVTDGDGDGDRHQIAEIEDSSLGLVNIEDTQPHINLKWATLYIQMTLCHLTLREWLDQRNGADNFTQFYTDFLQNRLQNNHLMNSIPRNSFCRQSSQLADPIESAPIGKDTSSRRSSESSRDESQSEQHVQHLDIVIDIFQQLLNGLNYIHSRGIVHHDIKPSNIFVSLSDHDSKLSIQLGDFGLACPLQSSHVGVGFGTPLYAAPEQLEGKCDPKSDIYSLGIILLELLLPFSTDMERAETIKQVRHGHYPPELERDFTMLLKNLLQMHPSRRPGMPDLVEAVNRIRINRDKVISELRRSLTLREEEIACLRSQIDVQQRVQVESHEERMLVEQRTRSLVVKEQELIYMNLEIQNKNLQLRTKEMELRSKDEEINKLKEMLRVYQEKEEKVQRSEA
ncbi:eukaryotic translation initiation factor 2-alpha kinase 1-like [Anopheles ziemanni]|uniref:eukaryotic translation initiation factor 2-alpha kinase 1-like n=1 Tax=Anopheles coustani TaxID=139045 RepID=UPI002657C63C|nr:eukaryotic translation initiation factor 2-alpha kinase 1-like [Anopheles coustani]XP_058171394.1 eukaryotic translation initiation factor 2-alpha kinase 1-like [Anopheles ziemanni]